ncbi:MFS transporter [Glacieibacterium sp.]|uniref:MFS transporter n=1 Tax=Glacieibacterium sp. TaxID=2860237 RepID=UPI003AFF9CB2
MIIFLCFLAAQLEGADIVSMGLAAPSVARLFGFHATEVSYILTAAIVGLMVGAAFGGRLGDRFGRKTVLLTAFVVFAAFSLLTALGSDLSSFVLIRLGCGLGLGAAFPNLIAIAAEAAAPERRATAVGLMFCGQPVGGTLLGLFVASQASHLDWRTIFYIGGILPLLLVPVLIFALPESAAFIRARAAVTGGDRPGVRSTLFGEGRTPVTLLLWVSYGFTQVVVYLINNWLPTLMVAKGFTPQQAALISAFENSGAVVGCIVLAMIADRGRLREVLAGTYLGISISLVCLASAQGLTPVVVSGIATGFFAIGGQLVLYTIAPAYYATLVRATGVGSAVSFGRLGGIAGPMAAGKLLAVGVAPGGVLLAAVPCALLAGGAALGLVFRHRPVEPL